VKAGAQQPQRQVELGGQEQDEQGLLELQAAVEQAQPDPDGHDRRADGGHHFQDEGRQEGDAQHAHGGLPVAVADLGDGLDLLPAAAQQLECGEPLEDVQKVCAHAAQ